MTENQKKLMPYVEAKAVSIIDDKEKNNVVPAIATEPEIVYGIRSDVIECMRELHRSRIFRATSTLNKPALMKNKNDRDKEK